KIAHARSAAAFCVDQLLAGDRISLVIFDDVVDLLVESQPAENRDAIKQRISGITARNSTALHEAWVKGGIEVSKHLVEGAINRVLLITDGLANVGVTNIDTIVSQASEVAARGVSTSTIGIGSDFNEDLLIPMAEAGRGNAWHVVEPQDMERIFESELKGLIAQVAHTVSLGLTPADGVRVHDLMNDFEVTHTGRYKLPNLRAGGPLEIVARLKVPARAAGERLKVLDLRLAWNPQSAPSSEREVVGDSCSLEYADPEEVARIPVDDRVARAVQLLMAARARREAIEQMDRGDIVAARATVGGTARMMAQACAPYLADSQVQEQMQALTDLEAELSAGVDMKQSRKKLSYQAYLTRLSKSLKQ
ncbi:MAG TPA: VWA domain-containing protein, partial [Blastocatellia bacterium]|nr:VWA domain-containing protein [Blastocatellia bacterium]